MCRACFFKAAQKLEPDTLNAKLVVRCARGYVGLSTGVMMACYFLSRSLYNNCQKWLHRPLFKLTRKDLTSNGYSSNSNLDLLGMLANEPRPHIFPCRLRSTYYQLYQSSHKHSIAFSVDKNSLRILNNIKRHEM